MPTSGQWLAELYDEMEEPGESIPCWERVRRPRAGRAGAHVSLGWALQEDGRLAEARSNYETAIQLQPDFAAAYLNLGGLQEEQGKLAEAEEAFRTALRLQPAFALPHARLATLLRGKLPDEDLAALEERLADDTRPRSRGGCCSPWPMRSTAGANTPAPPNACAKANELTLE